MDETGLFYRLEPWRSLATEAMKGAKRCKELISVALCCNANGSDKVAPLVIGKYANPRFFKHIDKSKLGVTYRSNKKAWMTGALFQEWLKFFDQRMRGRNIVLLRDNATSHVTDNIALQSVRILFLPPNTTSEIQPMDAGVIASFKAHYRAQFLKWKLKLLEKECYSKCNILQALQFIAVAWEKILQRDYQELLYTLQDPALFDQH